MPVYEILAEIHEDLVDFSSRIQAASSHRMENENHIGANVYASLYKMTAYATTLHRAILLLCESGWTHVNAILLRTIMECSTNCLAIVNNELPEYMAFKYIYYSYLQIFNDNSFPERRRDVAMNDVEEGYNNLTDETIKQKARQYIDSDRLDIFWFKPDERSISSIISSYGSDELKFMYGALSLSAHAGHLGMFMFKDNPDEIVINPTDNPRKTNEVLVMSCRLLSELINIRNESEGLGFNSEYDSFIERILATENEVRG
jgi:hypothetical protein